MAGIGSRSNVGEVTNRLRSLVLAHPSGAFIGTEETLERDFAVSKPTMRQAARMLEREGLLRVRRGNAGGYFASRPDADFIEATVATYLEVLQAKPEDLARVATALWVETTRQAAALAGDEAAALARKYGRIFSRTAPSASFSEVQQIEADLRRAVFALVGSQYVELIFNINANFARRKFEHSPATAMDDARHMLFVQAWLKSAQMLVNAIADGDAEVAVLAANRGRQLMHARLWPEEVGR